MPDGTQEYKYVDSFEISIDPWHGARLSFGARSPAGVDSEGNPRSVLHEHSHVVMPARHFKAMVFIMAKHMKKYEQQSGDNVGLPAELLSNAASASVEEWRKFWGETQWGVGQLDESIPGTPAEQVAPS